jgi:chromosome segregation protein
MLKLREVELFGFKSFADRTRIPLPDDLLVVVGPNGSGKSNVTDAVLWALGEQSARILRGHKMQDVIFGGSHKRPASGMAEVWLLFEDTDGAKTQIGRRLLRSGESQYLMDGHPVRLKDVQDYMLRYAISTQGSFLVEQGRVEALLKASPEERRMVLEEVAGIVHYKENRRSALQKLESAEANLLRLNDVITEVETQMVALKRQAQRADRFVRLSEELRSKRRAFWGRSFGQFTGKRTSLGRDLELFQKERQRRETALTQLEASLEEAKSKLNVHESSLAALIQKIHEQDLARGRAEAEITRKTDQIIACKNRLRQIAADLDQLKERVDAGQKECKRADAECRRLEKSAQKSQEDAERAKAELEEGRVKVEALESAQEALRQKAFSRAQEHSRLNAELARLEENLRRQAEHEKRLRREQEGLCERETAIKKQCEEAEAKSFDSDARLEALRNKRGDAETEAALLAESVEKGVAELASARETLAVSEGRVKVLLEHEASVRSTAHAYLSEHAPERAGTTLAEALSDVPEALVAPLSSVLGDLLEGYLNAQWEGLPKTLAELSREKAGQALFFLRRSGGRRDAPPEASGQKGFVGWLHEAEGTPAEVRALLPTAALTEDAADRKSVV